MRLAVTLNNLNWLLIQDFSKDLLAVLGIKKLENWTVKNFHFLIIRSCKMAAFYFYIEQSNLVSDRNFPETRLNSDITLARHALTTASVTP